MNIRQTSDWIFRRSVLAGLVAVAGIVLFLAGAAGAYAQSGETEAAPATPDQPTGAAIWVGMMDVEWNEVPGAETYEVQYFNMRGWVDLPGDGIEIAFYGAGAVVSELNPSRSYTFRVRAINSHGESDWSDFGWVPQTDRLEAWRDTPEPTNVAATGLPTISGTVETGETLTADVSGISDENGLERVRFHYQWVGSDGTTDTDIAGATNSSYTLTSSDAGNAMKVRVSFNDRQGFAETLTSAATPTTAEANEERTESQEGVCERTQQVREELVSIISGVSDCADVSASDLAGLDHYLDLSQLGIGELKAGDFEGLTNLEGLDLSGNELTDLPEGIFDVLTNLQALWLNSNSLTQLPDGVFSDLTELRDLSMYENSLTGLPDGVFTNLTKLRELNLSINDLEELPDGVFGGLSALEILYLLRMSLSELPPGAFDDLSGLRSLDLSRNGLIALPDGIFDSLTSLQRLDLDENSLTTLPEGAFDGLDNLYYLYLDNNNLNELPDGLFDDLSALYELDLVENQLTELPDGAFDNLSNLRYLHLQRNELTELPDGIGNLSELRQLRLYGNEIGELPDGMFDSMPKLEVLNISQSGVTGLPEGIKNLTKLQELVLFQFNSIGYTCLSLLRASWVENRQSIMAAASLRSPSSAATSRLSDASSPTRRFRHCLLKTLNSISAMFNQLP